MAKLERYGKRMIMSQFKIADQFHLYISHIQFVCSSGTLINVLPHRNAIPQTCDMTPYLVRIQTQGLSVIVLSIYVECHTGINYTFKCLRSDPTGKSFPALPHTPMNAKLYDAFMVVVSLKHSRKCTVHAGS